jgi:hypothetical protein
MPLALHWFVLKPIKLVNILVIDGKWKKQRALNRLYGASIWQKRTRQAVLAWF